MRWLRRRASQARQEGIRRGALDCAKLGLYWGYIRIVENETESTIEGLGFRI